MVEQNHQSLDGVFQSLADPTRRAMLSMLAGGELSVGSLAAPFSMSLAAASKHIQYLERAGLVDRSIRGRTHFCRLAPQALDEAQSWIEACQAFWQQQLDRLEQVLDETHASQAATSDKRRKRR